MANQDLQERHVYTDAFAITPNDATALSPTWGGLFVGGAGNVSVTTLDGSVVTFTGVLAGSFCLLWLRECGVQPRQPTLWG